MIFDALFGFGLSRALSIEAQDLLNCANQQNEALKIAIDISSGIDSDSGLAVSEIFFRADETLVLGAYKWAHWLEDGVEAAGLLRWVNLDLPAMQPNESAVFDFSRAAQGLRPRPDRKSVV